MEDHCDDGSRCENADLIDGLQDDLHQLTVQRDALLAACKAARITIKTMCAGTVTDGPAYVTLVEGTQAQLQAAIAQVEEVTQ